MQTRFKNYYTIVFDDYPPHTRDFSREYGDSS